MHVPKLRHSGIEYVAALLRLEKIAKGTRELQGGGLDVAHQQKKGIN